MQLKTPSVLESPSTHIEELARQTIPGRFQQFAELIPDQIALQTSEHSLTYAALNQAVNRLAHTLLATDHDRDLPVALLMPHDIESFIGMLGAAKAGYFFVPLDPTFPPAHNAHILRHSGADLLITIGGLSEEAGALLAQDQAGIKRLLLDDIPPDTPDTNPDVSITPDDYIQILYTSGSTGQVKGVIESHAGFVVNIAAWLDELGLGPGSHNAHFLSYSFAGSRGSSLGALLMGHTVFPYDLKQAGMQGLANWLLQHRINHATFLPSIFRRFMQAIPPDMQFPDLHALALGGEPVTNQDVELFKQHFPPPLGMFNIMAATETYVVAMNRITHHTRMSGERIPVGKPVNRHQVLVVDADLNPVPTGEIGELAVKGPYLALGYWRSTEDVGRRFIPDPDDPASRLYLVGDLARFISEDVLDILGRQDFEVKIRGYRVDLVAIEDHLSAHPEIEQAAARAFEDLRGENRVAAYIIPAPNSLLTAADLRDYLGDRVPEYLIPSYFTFVDSLPGTASGKVDRLKLPVPETGRPNLASAYVKPRDGLETRLTTLWENVLGVYPIGINDDFFELGGHSLLALQLFSQIERDFGHALPMDALFHASTVAAFARILREDQHDTTSETLVILREGGTKRPLFLIHPGGGHVLSYYHLMRHLDANLPLYGLQARGLDGRADPLTTIEEMAALYLDDIQRVQPQGPYRIAGYSLGGKIAYEMARLLHERGESTERLLLLDAYFGASDDAFTVDLLDLAVPNDPRTSGAGLVGGLQRDWRAMRGMTLRARMAFLGRLLRQRWDWYVRRPLRGGAAVTEQEMTPARRVQNACRRAYETYTPGPYAGSAIFVQAVGERLEDSAALWADVIEGGLDLIELPGSHRSILEEPDVQTLADYLNPLLS